VILLNGYYESRRQAIGDIDSMLENGTSAPVIKLTITKRYGFSGKIVDERINQHLTAKAERKKGKA